MTNQTPIPRSARQEQYLAIVACASHDRTLFYAYSDATAEELERRISSLQAFQGAKNGFVGVPRRYGLVDSEKISDAEVAVLKVNDAGESMNWQKLDEMICGQTFKPRLLKE